MPMEVGTSGAAAGRNSAPVTFPRLDRSDYSMWAMKMEVAMESQEIWDVVDPGGNTYAKGAANYRIDRLALAAIHAVVPNDVLQHLKGKKSAKDAWDTIKTLHQGHERVREANLQTLLRNYESLKMGEDEAVDVFAARVTTLVNGIRDLGETLIEISVVRRFLRTASPKYIQIVTSIEQCVDLKTLTVEDLVGCYKAHDERLRMVFGDGKDDEHLMMTRAQWSAMAARKTGDSSSSSGRRDQAKGEGRAQAKKAPQGTEEKGAAPKKKIDRKKVKCHNCGIYGHFKSECRKPQKEKAYMAREEDDDPALLMVEMCELMEKGQEKVIEEKSETVTLVEKKVYLHDKARVKAGNVWYGSTHIYGQIKERTGFSQSTIWDPLAIDVIVAWADMVGSWKATVRGSVA
ncbi:uncharacterized protein LOC104585067 [Brachypodium distachyon]|uniref:uncharacterized protein LOC104585067 n=1 Tax=Brachypodium distachyon TaxID=15368 RepID=UPI000D0D34A1|nr:uncharacterized protein LOC104585067 [Brachypodium distachyon]|eukprot:XP_024310389.1 uncharacterized protein LOC104585067 [Brachypodium distachyon]